MHTHVAMQAHVLHSFLSMSVIYLALLYAAAVAPGTSGRCDPWLGSNHAHTIQSKSLLWQQSLHYL
jgi:hypothetical protein